MTDTPEYKMLRIKPETHRKLRILAANADESIIDLIDRLATQETNKTMNMQQLAQQFGTVAHEGTEYTLTSVADFSSRLFDGNGLNAQEGEPYTVEFSCPAVDSEGNEYWVYWQFDNIIKGEEPAPDMYDWTHGDEHITRIDPA